MTERITIAFQDGVADVRLNRPDKMNALDPAMFEAVVQTLDRLRALSGLRAVVLSGEGRAFCAGLDMANFADLASGQAAALSDLHIRTHGDANLFQHVVTGWRDLPVPVIAAVHGAAFGGGFQLGLGADIRVIAPDARLSVMEIKWGLVPDMGGVALMPLLARDDVIRDLTYSGRIFSGEEALAFGFATRLAADPRAEALAVAAAIAGQSPDAIQAAKRLYNLAGDARRAEVLIAESVEQQALMGRANQIEAVVANLEKRPPRFTDR